MMWHLVDSHDVEWRRLCCGSRPINITSGRVASCDGIRPIHMMPSGILENFCVTNFCKFFEFLPLSPAFNEKMFLFNGYDDSALERSR